ncbi:Rcf3p PWA37_005324 [Arxiozyma heterogenica]|uniref:Uncharacterized protein n=1 Tax=Arxiozyma heterogenica TaxID=278026 RepID=A0AAN7WPK0_9SACH|nr:hypothetical protein RI543_000255 [Kazachstania heterogenica]
MSNGRLQPVHYDKETLKELTKQIAYASIIGGAKGALFSVTSALILTKTSRIFRTLRLPLKIFYHCAIISSGIILSGEAQVNKFQSQYYQNELQKRQKLLDEAADNGVFLDENYISKSVISADQGRVAK